MPLKDQKVCWNQLRAGNKEALYTLYNDTYFHLFRFGVKITGNDELVKDCINQIFLNLWDKKDRLSEVENVRAYLYMILRNIIIDELAQQGKLETALQNKVLEDDKDERPYEDIIIEVQNDEAIKVKLHSAIQKLTPRQIQLIQMRFFEGLSYEQIAESTSQSIKTAYNTIYDAVKMLRKMLK
jgi:RNA polymerase sigma factor (sigma-70 family)